MPTDRPRLKDLGLFDYAEEGSTVSNVIKRFSEHSLRHWREGHCRVGTSCASCRAGWALDSHPEWEGILPVGWKDQIDEVEGWREFALDLQEPDRFKLQMRRAIRRAPDRFKAQVADALERAGGT